MPEYSGYKNRSKFHKKESTSTLLGKTLPSNIDAEKSSFSAIAIGIDYSYRMDESWSIVFKGGYSIKNKYDLLDNDNNIIYSFDSSAKPYFSTGVKFNLNRKFNNNRIK